MKAGIIHHNMGKNKIIIRLCYIEFIIFSGILAAMIFHSKHGFGKSFFALMIIATLTGCGISLALKDYLKGMIQSSTFELLQVTITRNTREKATADSRRR